MYEELFDRKILNTEKTLLFGFVKTINDLRYETDILDGSVATEDIYKHIDESYRLAL